MQAVRLSEFADGPPSHCAALLLLVLSKPLEMQSYSLLHFRMFLCILLSLSIMITITGVDLYR